MCARRSKISLFLPLPSAGNGRKRGKLRNIAQYFAIEKIQRREPTNTGWEPGLKGTGSGRFKPPVPPPRKAVLVAMS